MKKAEVVDGVVKNVIVVDPNNVPEWCAEWPDATDDAEVGGTYAGGVFTRAPRPDPEPEPIPNLTFAQLLFGLVTEGWLTEAEGTAWLVDRTLPAAVEALISTLPANQQLLARARALQPTEVLFSDPMVQAMGAAQGKTVAEMETFFRTYSAV